YSIPYPMPPRTPRSTLFPYTTLFRSRGGPDAGPAHHAAGDAEGAGGRQVRRRAAHGGRGDDHGGDAREARRLREARARRGGRRRSEEHTSELQSPYDLVCRLLLEKIK